MMAFWPGAGLGAPAAGSATTTAPATGAPVTAATVIESAKDADFACGTARTVLAITQATNVTLLLCICKVD